MVTGFTTSEMMSRQYDRGRRCLHEGLGWALSRLHVNNRCRPSFRVVRIDGW
jgi:hypothetical protein